ncbi:MAG TPA: hypothetical protein VF487_02625 [Chitinophagaceae bacterium]
MEKFRLLLKNDKLAQYNLIALFVVLLNIFLFVYISIYTPERGIKIAALICLSTTLIVTGIHFFLKRIKNNTGTPYLHAGISITTLGWLQMEHYLAAAVCFILGLLYIFSKKILTVRFFTDKIIYTSLPQKNISWAELNNVILKDGILTVDFRNNKIIQSEIESPDSQLNEKEFNDFCRGQLSK